MKNRAIRILDKLIEIETSEKLEDLPATLRFPNGFQDKIRYDANRGELIYKGVMASEELRELSKLAPNDSFRKAILGIFYKSFSQSRQRFLELLAEFDFLPGEDSKAIHRYAKSYAKEWYMSIPEAFRPALDMEQSERKIEGQKRLVWTQGSRFSFKLGDTLYDSHHAYKAWPEGLQDTDLCIQVKEASQAVPSDRKGKKSTQIDWRKTFKSSPSKTIEEAIKLSQIPRDPGKVGFVIKTPDEDRQAMVERTSKTLTQDEFVRFLIIGLPEDWFRRYSITAHQ